MRDEEKEIGTVILHSKRLQQQTTKARGLRGAAHNARWRPSRRTETAQVAPHLDDAVLVPAITSQTTCGVPSRIFQPSGGGCRDAATSAFTRTLNSSYSRWKNEARRGSVSPGFRWNWWAIPRSQRLAVSMGNTF